MIKRHISSDREVIIRFGQSTLVRTDHGKIELLNPTAETRTEAKEFVSLFLHDAVVDYGKQSGK